MNEPYDSRQDTEKHICRVGELLGRCRDNLLERAVFHDASKLGPEEKPVFDEYTPKLKDSTYGSDEYKGFLAAMKPALGHHYANNSHHSEHFDTWKCLECGRLYTHNDVPSVGYPSDNGYRWCTDCYPNGYPGFFETALQHIPGISGMSLLDLIELLCDWKAAGERHDNGSIEKSLEINKTRFGIDDQLFAILRNTAKELGWLS